MPMTVIQYVLSRLHSLGVTDVFGVPGDFSFPVCDAICEDPRMRWIGCCNELNAAYAADGYARVKGFAAISTTYGVGELSALNGIAGAYAEHLPCFTWSVRQAWACRRGGRSCTTPSATANTICFSA
jgi:indolepyruvate decarboxylase